MRTTNSQITAVMSRSMDSSTAKLAKLMQQLATNKRIQLPSDDPIASVRLLRIQREEASLTQYGANIANVSSSLSTQEVNLTAASDTMLNVRDLLLWAANGSNTSEDLAAIAGELESLEKTLVSFINVRDEEGRYLFAGTLNDAPTLTFDSVAQTYAVTGNAKHRQTAVANGVLVPQNVTAAEIFGANIDMLNEIHNLVAALKDPLLNASDPAVRQQIDTAIDQLDATQTGVLGAITELGGRQNTLTLLSDSNEQVSLVNKKIDGDLSTLDYPAASIDLTNYQLSLQATQKAYLKINELSLFSLM
jgi:flagellar hook-associated protein 3 FlgL